MHEVASVKMSDWIIVNNQQSRKVAGEGAAMQPDTISRLQNIYRLIPHSEKSREEQRSILPPLLILAQCSCRTFTAGRLWGDADWCK